LIIRKAERDGGTRRDAWPQVSSKVPRGSSWVNSAKPMACRHTCSERGERGKLTQPDSPVDGSHSQRLAGTTAGVQSRDGRHQGARLIPAWSGGLAPCTSPNTGANSGNHQQSRQARCQSYAPPHSINTPIMNVTT